MFDTAKTNRLTDGFATEQVRSLAHFVEPILKYVINMQGHIKHAKTFYHCIITSLICLSNGINGGNNNTS